VSYLLDTCVLSQGIKPAIDAQAARWLLDTPQEEQFTSVLALGEIRFGIDSLRDGKRKEQLKDWYGALRDGLANRVLAFDEDCAMVWAALRVRFPNAKLVDTQIAATAMVNGLTLVTRNIRDFAFPHLSVFNPWSK
jgi:predicted nucleic acid-binding protein